MKKRWLPLCAGGLLLGACIAWSAEKDSASKSGQAAPEQKSFAQFDPTHRYYVLFKGEKGSGERKEGIFEVQADWTLNGGLRKIESKTITIPIDSESEVTKELAKGGWYASKGEKFQRLCGDPRGLKRGYPHPLYWYQDLERMGKYFYAVVAGVTPTDEGASVQLTLLPEQGTNSAKKPDREGKKETVAVSWKNALGPVPVATGQQVRALVNAQREVLQIHFDAVPRFWRKGPDGKIEIAFNPDPDSGKPASGLLLLKPTGLRRGQTWAHWIPKLGVFLYVDAAGGPVLEPPSLPSDKSGIQLINVPNLRLQPGRDGWKRAKFDSARWEDCPEVPADQETAGAG